MEGPVRNEPSFVCWFYAALSAGLDPLAPAPPPLGLAGNPHDRLLPGLAALERRWPGTLPEALAARTKNVGAQVTAQNLVTLGDFRPLAEDMETAGMRWAALKGLDHLARFYPGPQWRVMGDVDVLVHPDCLADV